MEDENKGIDTSVQEGENSEETNEESTETVESLKAQLAKSNEIAENQKIRAEKAEKKNKPVIEDKPAPKKEATDQSLTSKDVLALTGAGITSDEDVEYLLKVSKGFGMTIAEAIKDQTIKAKLEDQQEERKTADATNTKGGSQSNAKVSGATLMAKASKGNLPDNDADMSKLVSARFKKK